MYRNNTKTRVATPDGETQLFDISAGVIQGDTLAPFLFMIVLDLTVRKALADAAAAAIEVVDVVVAAVVVTAAVVVAVIVVVVV
ncbi:hypothetical protein ElyMa_000284100 [Elysia marginata]|uniref:Reverse transcriptase domain-containing protein n=1 Tax=Elysia marginata TaxID=1093978 RepID=A0AAV4F8Q2_9GAST|nr:hypothetical protein ElyMa_000284100 [Elysia marginata]